MCQHGLKLGHSAIPSVQGKHTASLMFLIEGSMSNEEDALRHLKLFLPDTRNIYVVLVIDCGA